MGADARIRTSSRRRTRGGLYPRRDRRSTPRGSFIMPDRWPCSAVIALWVIVAGALPPASGQVVVYCSIDENVGRQVLDAYKARTGLEVSAVYDSEAGKTTGLVQRIVRESQAGRPRADVFWSSELFNTILLARMGLLEAYESPQAADIPARFKDREHRWTALAVRARVLAFHP